MVNGKMHPRFNTARHFHFHCWLNFQINIITNYRTLKTSAGQFFLFCFVMFLFCFVLFCFVFFFKFWLKRPKLIDYILPALNVSVFYRRSREFEFPINVKDKPKVVLKIKPLYTGLSTFGFCLFVCFLFYSLFFLCCIIFFKIFIS